MINLPLANILINIVAVFWLLCALLLIFIILIQKGKGGGLGGAFGGAGGGGGLLGTKTGDFLTWVTIGLVFAFFFFAIILVKFGGSIAKPTGLDAPLSGTSTTAPADTGDENTATEGTTEGEDTSGTGNAPGAEESTGNEASGGTGTVDGGDDSPDM